MIIGVSAVQPCRGSVRGSPSCTGSRSLRTRPQFNSEIKFIRPNGFGFLRPARLASRGGESNRKSFGMTGCDLSGGEPGAELSVALSERDPFRWRPRQVTAGRRRTAGALGPAGQPGVADLETDQGAVRPAADVVVRRRLPGDLLLGGHPAEGLDLLLQPGRQFEGEGARGGVAALDEARLKGGDARRVAAEDLGHVAGQGGAVAFGDAPELGQRVARAGQLAARVVQREDAAQARHRQAQLAAAEVRAEVPVYFVSLVDDRDTRGAGIVTEADPHLRLLAAVGGAVPRGLASLQQVPF